MQLQRAQSGWSRLGQLRLWRVYTLTVTTDLSALGLSAPASIAFCEFLSFSTWIMNHSFCVELVQSSIGSGFGQMAVRKGEKGLKSLWISYTFPTHCVFQEGTTWRVNNLRIGCGGWI